MFIFRSCQVLGVLVVQTQRRLLCHFVVMGFIIFAKWQFQVLLKFVYENQLDTQISQIYSWSETLHVSDSSSVHHREFFTVHTTMLYVI